MKTLRIESLCAMNPTLALDLLKKGNQRFVNNLKFRRNILIQKHVVPQSFAVVLSCVDLQNSAELIFNQNLGDIFCVHMAGNTVNNKILSSIEFACKVAGSKLIVVLGHTQCGAVRNTCDHIKVDGLTSLLVKIQPAVYYNFLDKISTLSIKRTVQAVQERSPLLKDMIAKGKIGIIGGSYDASSGKITFFDDTLVINEPASKTQIKTPSVQTKIPKTRTKKAVALS